MSRDTFIMIGCLLTMLGIYMFYQGTQSFSEKDTQSITESIISKHRPRIVYFFSDLCGVCTRFKPVIEGEAEVYRDSIDFQPVNVTIVTGGSSTMNLIQTFHITGVPTTIIFDCNGQQVFAQSGSIDRLTLNDVLRSIYLPTVEKPPKGKAKK